MEYKYKKRNVWEEMQAEVGVVPDIIETSGNGMLLVFTEELTAEQKVKLDSLMQEKGYIEEI